MKYLFLSEEELVEILRKERGNCPPAQHQQTEIKPLATTKQLCEFVGITEPTVIRWRGKGKIPFLQIGSAYRYDLDAVLQALAVSKKKGSQK